MLRCAREGLGTGECHLGWILIDCLALHNAARPHKWINQVVRSHNVTWHEFPLTPVPPGGFRRVHRSPSLFKRLDSAENRKAPEPRLCVFFLAHFGEHVIFGFGAYNQRGGGEISGP